MKFVDEATIHVRAGDGGRGMVSFRREPYVPRGGPNGGNGGAGGDVVVSADPQLHTLLDFKYQRHHRADRGGHGGSSDRTGRSADSLVLRVPVGTQVFDAEDGMLLCDLDTAEASFVVARGGRGGRGNKAFMNARRQAPDFAEPGHSGEERTIRLELKLLADAGLIGFPNVGKSTLISRISAARPKVADYPFTTLTPQLGVVSVGIDQSFVVADIPGLIPGAHEGAGLGHRFLRHVERSGLLWHLVTVHPDEPGRDPVSDFEVLCHELEQFDDELARRPQLVVLTKMDLPFVRERESELAQEFRSRGHDFFAISAATGEGIADLLNAASARLSAEPG